MKKLGGWMGFTVLVLLMTGLFLSCADRTPPNVPKVYGVEDGGIYARDVIIKIKEQEGVEYHAEIDGAPYHPGERYGVDGYHLLKVTAVKQNNKLTSQALINFEIDKEPPGKPYVTGVKANTTYFKGVRINVRKDKGVEYRATIDQSPFDIGSCYTAEGRHVLEVTAIKSRNGMKSKTVIPFTIIRLAKEDLEYLTDIAFGSEFGNESPGVINKWTEDILIKVHGTPEQEDLNTLDTVVEELNNLIDTIDIRTSNSDLDNSLEYQNFIHVYFVPQKDFPKYIDYEDVGEDWGLFEFYSTQEGVIYEAKVLISTDQPTREEKNHLIREELTQSLGLAQDSWKYSDSVFFQGWTTVQEYSDMDRKVIRMLYNADIKPGTKKREVVEYYSEKIDLAFHYMLFHGIL